MVLGAALAHAVWNTASKGKRGDTVSYVWAYTALSAVLCLPIAAARVLAGGVQVGFPLLLAALVSAALHVVYSLTLQTGYDRSELGIVYPTARGSAPVLTMACAIVLFREHLSVTEVLGVLAVVAGILVTVGNPFRAAAEGGAVRASSWGLLTGVTIAGYTLWDAHAVGALRLDPLTYFTGTLVLEAVLLAPRALRAPPGWLASTVRDNPRTIPLIAVLSPVSYVLVLVAMQRAPVALVAPLRESSIVFGTFLAWWLLREGHLARRLVGAAVVLVGIVAISV